MSTFRDRITLRFYIYVYLYVVSSDCAEGSTRVTFVKHRVMCVTANYLRVYK